MFAVAVGEIAAAHSVLLLEMADDGLDGGEASYLSFDLRGHPSLLLACAHRSMATWVSG